MPRGDSDSHWSRLYQVPGGLWWTKSKDSNTWYDVTSLIPPIRKHTFAPEVDPAGLVDDEAEFEALNNIDWSSSTFQEKEQSASA